MTLRDVSTLVQHWRKHPPAHLALANLRSIFLAYLGVTEDPDADEPKTERHSMAELQMMAAQMNAGARLGK